MKKWLKGAAGLLIFTGVWETAVRTGLLPGNLVPAPSRIPAAFIAEIRLGIWSRMLLGSLRHYITGLLAGSLLGITLGISTALFRPVREYLSLLIRVFRPIPPLAWIPFAIIWFGISEISASFIISIGVFWINFFASAGAVRSVSGEYLELADAFGHTRLSARVKKIILPAALPGILTGLHTGIGQAWMTVVAAEMFGINGLGQRMQEASGLLAIEVVAVYMISIALLYSLTDLLFTLLERRLMQWWN